MRICWNLRDNYMLKYIIKIFWFFNVRGYLAYIHQILLICSNFAIFHEFFVLCNIKTNSFFVFCWRMNLIEFSKLQTFDIYNRNLIFSGFQAIRGNSAISNQYLFEFSGWLLAFVYIKYLFLKLLLHLSNVFPPCNKKEIV